MPAHAEALINRPDNPLAVATARRRNGWDSLDDARSYLLAKPTFSTWHPESLECFLKHALKNEDGKLYLKCDPSFESKLYTGVPHGLWARLPELRPSVRLVVGENSKHMSFGVGSAEATTQFYMEEMMGQLPSDRSTGHVMRGTTHFMVMEDPASSAQEVRELSAGLRIKIVLPASTSRDAPGRLPSMSVCLRGSSPPPPLCASCSSVLLSDCSSPVDKRPAGTTQASASITNLMGCVFISAESLPCKHAAVRKKSNPNPYSGILHGPGASLFIRALSS